MEKIRMDRAVYNRVVKNVKSTIRGMNREPQLPDFVGRQVDSFDRAVRTVLWIGIAIAVLSSFVYSAGKEIVAADAILQPIQQSSARLSAAWTDFAIIDLLLLGEIGVALFGLFSSLYPGDKHPRFNVSFQGLTFRIAAMICAMLALGSNMLVTSMHSAEYGALQPFAWMVAIIPPGVIIIAVLAMEAMLKSTLQDRRVAKDKYYTARAGWLVLNEHPEQHPLWLETLHPAIFEELLRYADPEQAKFLLSLPDQDKSNIVHSVISDFTDWFKLAPTTINPTPAAQTLHPILSGLPTNNKLPIN